MLWHTEEGEGQEDVGRWFAVVVVLVVVGVVVLGVSLVIQFLVVE